MSVDKFGRTKRYTGTSGAQQVLIPHNLRRTDGTNVMQANLDVNNNGIVNLVAIQGDDVLVNGNPISSDSMVPKYMLDMTKESVDTLFDEDNIAMNLTNATVTASNHHSAWARPQHLVDNRAITMWIVGEHERNKYAWVLKEVLNLVQVWRCALFPRTGAQQTTQLLTKYYLEGSEDNVTYYRIFASNLDEDRDRHFEFPVTPPYKYFKLTCTGKSFYGFTEMKLYRATPNQELKGDKGDKGEQGIQGPQGLSGPTMQIDPKGHLTMSSNGLRLCPTNIETLAISTTVINAAHMSADTISTQGLTVQQQRTAGKLDIINQQIFGLVSPTKDSQAVTEKFFDYALTHVYGTINQAANSKVGYALLTYGGSNITIGDELDLVSAYNDIGTLNKDELIFT